MAGVHKRFEIFPIINASLLLFLAVLCVLPFIHVLAISFSKSFIAAAGEVSFWPKGFSTSSYKAVITRMEFWKAMLISVQRVTMGVVINMFLTVLAAYPLSKETKNFPRRTFYVWIIFFTMLFNGGLIPTYMLIRQLNMLDTIWALILPAPIGVPVWNILILLNFFRNIPKELEEAAHIDGASHWTTLIKIYLPTSLPALATLTLFVSVFHWNAWFDGMIYMKTPYKYPLQTFLRTVITMPDVSYMSNMTMEEARELAEISSRTVKSAQIFLASLPILLVYPFLQRYFVKGVVLGGVKG